MEWPPVEREDPSGPATRRVSHIAPHNATWTMAAAEGAPAAPRTRDSAWRSPGPDAAVGGDGRAAGGVAFHVGRPTGIVEVRVQ